MMERWVEMGGDVKCEESREIIVDVVECAYILSYFGCWFL